MCTCSTYVYDCDNIYEYVYVDELVWFEGTVYVGLHMCEYVSMCACKYECVYVFDIV